MKRVYEIDGADFKDLEGFYDQISAKLIPGAEWGRNLSAFDDILYGGFGTPDEGFILVWKNHELSRVNLGYEEAARRFRKTLSTCRPSNREDVAQYLAEALAHKGPVLFDTLLEILQSDDHADIDVRLE